jgi:hypothetical protein
MAQDKKGKVKIEKRNDITRKGNQSNKGKAQVLGYVPVQISNLSLEEVELAKRMYVGVASHILTDKTQEFKGYEVNPVLRDHEVVSHEFEDYLRGKLTHLKKTDHHILESVLRQYKHLFYGLGTTDLGSTKQAEHSIETGDARPIKRTPYRTPHALKSVVDDHIDDMLKRKIIEHSVSLWSSSIVLVQKKSKDGSIRYRFCVDYRSLNGRN